MTAEPAPQNAPTSPALFVSPVVAHSNDAASFFDGLAWLAAQTLATPYAQVTLLDKQTFRSVGQVGFVGPDPDPAGDPFSHRVLTANGPVAIDDSRTDPLADTHLLVEHLTVAAWAGSPIRGLSDEVVGTVYVIDTVTREWTDEHRRALEVLASSAGAEVQRRAQVSQWDRAEIALAAQVDSRGIVETRAVLIATLTRRLGACVTVDDVALAIVEAGAALLDAAFATVATASAEQRILTVRCSTGLTTVNEPGGQSTIPIDEPTPLCDAIRSGRPVVLVDHAQRSANYPTSADDAATAGLVSSVALPLRAADGALIGVLGLGWSERIEFSVAQWALLDTTAELCAQTMQRCELADTRRDLVVSLQHELLPAVPPIRGLDIAVRYTPARHELGFGGDWYDVVVIDDDRTAFIVGDVCGHGVRAAARMAEIRSTVGALVRLLPDDLGSVLDRSDLMLRHFDDPFLATVVIAVIQLDRETVSFVSAGHPPLVLVRPDGSWLALEGGRRAVLGAGGKGSVVPGQAEFPPSSVLAAFTDGLVERRDRPLDDGVRQLAEALTEHRTQDVDHIATAVAERLGEHPHDDVAMVIVRSQLSDGQRG